MLTAYIRVRIPVSIEFASSSVGWYRGLRTLHMPKPSSHSRHKPLSPLTPGPRFALIINLIRDDVQ